MFAIESVDLRKFSDYGFLTDFSRKARAPWMIVRWSARNRNDDNLISFISHWTPFKNHWINYYNRYNKCESISASLRYSSEWIQWFDGHCSFDRYTMIKIHKFPFHAVHNFCTNVGYLVHKCFLATKVWKTLWMMIIFLSRNTHKWLGLVRDNQVDAYKWHRPNFAASLTFWLDLAKSNFFRLYLSKSVFTGDSWINQHRRIALTYWQTFIILYSQYACIGDLRHNSHKYILKVCYWWLTI